LDEWSLREYSCWVSFHSIAAYALFVPVVFDLSINQPAAGFLPQLNFNRIRPRQLAVDLPMAKAAAEERRELRFGRIWASPIVEFHLEIADRNFMELSLS
jgi:hypothetical protein